MAELRARQATSPPDGGHCENFSQGAGPNYTPAQNYYATQNHSNPSQTQSSFGPQVGFPF